MSKCTYCGKTILLSRGVTFVTKDARILYFCCHKCRMNFFQGRKKKKWALKLKSETKSAPAVNPAEKTEKSEAK
ncbi:50S ribosomal protein L24 [Candidatus Pacearchaeota archaeon CG06_land_8_20_14_3_00_35_12]|nr:MAG: 50S ribosomal protein L24 [Candidatus Pacearchaeota archaeon CG06_land_8_20_14_3_00_35_12]